MDITLNPDDQEQMKQEIERVQKMFDDLLDVCREQQDQMKNNLKQLDDAEKSIKELTDSNLSMIEAIKGIFKTMSAKADILNKDKDLKELLDIMAKFMLSPAVIKAGVITNARKES